MELATLKANSLTYVTANYRAQLKTKKVLLLLLAFVHILGCSPTYRPEPGAADLGGDSWKGGFYCPCHGSKFDLAGRVYAGVPAPTNLVIPPYQYVTDSLIRVGVDQQNT